MGLSFAMTTSRVIVTSRSFFWFGTWYIRSSISSSMIIRRPRAPILRSSADSAIASRASSVKRSFTFSYSNSFMYCRVMALRGCVRIWMRAGLSSSCSVPTTGSRPTNSGMRPYLIRSCGSSCSSVAPMSRARSDFTSALNPRVFLPTRRSICLSRPTKAPPQIKRILLVSTWKNSWCGCLRPPCGGTFATGRLEQFEDDVLDILADVARFGERRRVDDREGYRQQLREGLREQRLAGAGRADEQDVALGQLDVVAAARLLLNLDALVVVVDRDSELFLGPFL